MSGRAKSLSECRCGCGALVRGSWKSGHNPSQPPATERYTVNEATGCWNWDGWVNPRGYGAVRPRRGTVVFAHRFIYEQLVGPIPQGLTLDHLCRNRRCVNPEHLEPVPMQVNAQRGVAVKLTPATVREIRASSETNVALARRYGVAETTVRYARSGVHWSNVTEVAA